jgi:hypothetical protein
MAEPTLQEIFGASATQTATTLTITKADLASTGLTASGTNTGESLLGAILALGSTTLTDANFQTNLDQSVTIARQSDTITYRGQDTYTQKPWTVNFNKIAPAPTFDPDDY